jgi:hypothetical protein
MTKHDIDADFDTKAVNQEIAAANYHSALFKRLSKDNGVITSNLLARSISSKDVGEYEQFAVKDRLDNGSIAAIDVFGNEEIFKLIDGVYIAQDNKPVWAK